MNTNAIKKSLSSIREQYCLRVNKFVDENNGMSPTIDRNGRYHAPCDGYMWIDGNVYLAGQYMPNDEEHTQSGMSLKIKIAESVYALLQEILDCSKGKSWIENGVSVCYAYANVTKAEYNALVKILPSGGKTIVLADESTKSKTWVFDSKKIVRSFVYKFGYDWVQCFMDMAEEAYPGVTFNTVLKKDGKITFRSDFDGKTVCYRYSTFISE